MSAGPTDPVKLRVLLMVGPATGGMASHVVGLSTGLAGLGWPVTVYSTPQTIARFSFGGTTLDGWPRGSLVTDRARQLRALRTRFRQTDVVHAHGHQAGLLAVLVARSLHRRDRPVLVISWHNAILVTGWRRRLLVLAETLQARAATQITGASADLVSRARALGARTASVAEVAAAAPVSVSRADETAADRLLASLMPAERGADDGPVVLTVSRIAVQKRLDVLVDAATLLGHRFPSLRWLVAGDGDAELLAGLERRATVLKAPVSFLGARSDIPALMAVSDVFALSSAWEARALVVQEAMAAGLPVVATSVGGLPELLGQTGLLVPAGDASALADAVERLLTDRTLAGQLAAAARRRFAELPTEDEVVDGWVRRYERLTRPA